MIKIAIVVFILFLLTLGGGCAILRPTPLAPPSIPSPNSSMGQQALYEVVHSTNWLATLAVVGIAASVFAIFNGSSAGFGGLAACITLLVLALSVARYATALAVAGGAVLLACFGLVVWTIWTKNRAVFELVAAGEKIKKSNGETKTIFKEVQSRVQSAATTELVSKARQKLKREKDESNK